MSLTAADVAPGVSPSERLEVLFGELAELTGQRNAIDGQIVEIVAEMDRDGLSGSTGCRSMPALVAWKTGVSPNNADTVVAVARRLPEFPRLAAGMREGRLSLDQVGVIAERAADGSDEHYAELARSATVSQLRTAVKLEPRPDPEVPPEPQRSITKTDGPGGEYTTWKIRLPRLEAAKFEAAHQSHRDALIADHQRHHGDGSDGDGSDGDGGSNTWGYGLTAFRDNGPMTHTAESTRVASLRDAERKAHLLFDEVVARGMIVPGVGERQLSDQIRDLAAEMFGTVKFWHKRIARAGVNTVHPYAENPPDRVLTDDDILFLDFGPIFAQWEADFGRTYVLGDDPAKHRLADDLPRIWEAGRVYFDSHPDITGAQLFSYVTELVSAGGWGHVGEHAGHLVGEFPHLRIDGDKFLSYIAPGNTNPMRRVDPAGRECHWILEVHLIDRGGGFGGFFEQLLDVPSA